MNKLAKTTLVSFFVIAVTCLSVFAFWAFQNESFLEQTYVDMEIFINKGDSPNKVYETIFNDDIKTPIGFKTYLIRIKKFARDIKYGYYSSSNISLGDFLQNIKNGIETTIKITIPEGYNLYEIAMALERVGITKKDKIINKAFDKDTVRKITGENYPSIEGFLAPGTYFFPKSCDVEAIFKSMHADFKKNLPSDFKSKAAKLGLSEYEAVILASIVQKETYLETEAPVVASVFLNRLKTNMRLQADPTIIYGIYREFDGNIRRKNIDDSTNIYNTYRHNGLPPTPISNPSTISLNAVINPSDTNYIYFVANKKGTHFFSETYLEHLQNVKKYISR